MRSKYKTLSAVGLFMLCIAFAGVGCSQSPDTEGNLDGGPTDTKDAGDADAVHLCDAACLPCPSLGCDCAPCTPNGLLCPDAGIDLGDTSRVEACRRDAF